MRTIWKFPVKLEGGRLMLSKAHRILDAQLQGGELCLWVLADFAAPRTAAVEVSVHGTGGAGPDELATYVATVQQSRFVWHIFSTVFASAEGGLSGKA